MARLTASAPGPRTRTQRRPSIARLAGLVVALGLLLPTQLLIAGSASAHGGLLWSYPSDGEVVGAPLQEMRLYFDSGLADVGAALSVVDPSGLEVPTSPLTVEGGTLRTAVSAAAHGDYSVAWRAVSGDGHPQTGSFSFTVVDPVDVPAAAGEQPPREAEAAPAAAGGVSGEQGWLSRHSGHVFAAWVVIVVSGAYLGVDVWRRRQRRT